MSDSSSYLDLSDRIADSFDEIENDKVMEGSGELSLSAEEHAVLTKFFRLQFRLESMERQHIYFRGHTDCYSYLKKVGAL